jgi:hypothetical protein
VDNRRHPFTGWATLPHRGTRHRTGRVRRARVGLVRYARVGLVRCALDDAVQGAGWTRVVGHGGSLA